MSTQKTEASYYSLLGGMEAKGKKFIYEKRHNSFVFEITKIRRPIRFPDVRRIVLYDMSITDFVEGEPVGRTTIRATEKVNRGDISFIPFRQSR